MLIVKFKVLQHFPIQQIVSVLSMKIVAKLWRSLQLMIYQKKINIHSCGFCIGKNMYKYFPCILLIFCFTFFCLYRYMFIVLYVFICHLEHKKRVKYRLIYTKLGTCNKTSSRNKWINSTL